MHWHRMQDMREAGDYPDEDFTGGRWLSLDFGFAVEEVHYLAEGDHWCYTVGLARYGHPEFKLAGFDYGVACVILSGLAWQVVQGRWFEVSDSPVALGESQVRLFRDDSEISRRMFSFLPLANVLNKGPVDWLDVVVDFPKPRV